MFKKINLILIFEMATEFKLDSEVLKVPNQSFGPFTKDLFFQQGNSYLPDPLEKQFDAWREGLRLSHFQLDQQMSEEDKLPRSNTVDCLPGETSADSILTLMLMGLPGPYMVWWSVGRKCLRATYFHF